MQFPFTFISGKRPLVFKRPVQSFDAVLAYYQTGDLHMPTSVCPGSFKTELEFWGLDPQIMAKCCYYRYLSFQDDQETLDKFHQHLFPEVGQQKTPLRCLGGVRQTLWRIFDFHDKSILAKIYFWLCTLMVVLSVLTIALSSLPEFRRNLTKCELEEFLGKPLKTTDAKQDPIYNDTCSTPVADDVLETIYVDYELVNVNKSRLRPNDIVLNDTILAILNETKAKQKNITIPPRRSGLFNLNDGATPRVSDERLAGILFEALRPKVGIGRKTVRIQTLVYIDFVVLGFFTADLLLRVLCCPSIRRYFLSMINAIDALVVLSAYALIIINNLKTDEKYEDTNVDLLEIFQVLRVVRLMRIVRDVIGFKVLTFSLRVTVKDLSVLLLYLTVAVLIFANFIFFVESREQIESVPVGWWWAISTLTTVGYGDVVPRSLYGRIIGGLCAISGVVMISVAIPVVVKTFILLYAYAVLYKKSLHKPEDTHRYIHRHAVSGNHVDSRNKQNHDNQ
ncbi:Potassium voltage-gated channel subfamily A member 2 [Mactra antiquata]